jgi:putative aldouronate transport system substrate-binding protein
MAVPGENHVEDTRLKEEIARCTGASAQVEFLGGQTPEEKIEAMIQTGNYPDFINGADASSLLIEAGALIPLEDYLEDYPALYHYLTPRQWESLRKEDGHIYYIPPFGVIQGHNTQTMFSGESFWIQKRVLEWAGFPEVKTLDEYFDLIVSFLEANPQSDGKPNIGFEILCDDWRYFCLENPAMFLAGYPNEGCAIVDPETQEAAVYDTIPEAKQYYQKLSQMYSQGVVDPETFTLSYSQYIDKISAGNVLGFVDQYWQIMDAQNTLYAFGREDRTYVPLAITANEGIEGKYNCTEPNLNIGAGLGISVDCRDVEGALQFLNDLLTPELMVLRYWGVKGVDYEVDDAGVYYRTKEQRENWANGDYMKENRCDYTYFPAYEGMLADGINASRPAEQPGEYYEKLSPYDKKVLDAYGFQTWKEFLGEEWEGSAWFPLYSCVADWPADSTYGQAKAEMERIKRLWLPKVIMSSEEEFEENWTDYMQDYADNVDVEAYITQLNIEIKKRVEAAKEEG